MAVRRWWPVVALVVVAPVVAASTSLSCSSGHSADQPEARAAAVYESILRWFAAERTTDPEPLPVFVEPRGEGTEIALAVQADVVSAVRDVAIVRFVDTRDEAFATDAAEPPVVVDGGMLVRFAPVNDTSKVVAVTVDVYDERTDGDGTAQFRTLEFRLVSADDRWLVSGDPETVPPR